MTRPEIGKVCPDFSFQNVMYSKEKKLSLGKLKGKWIVLDFWGEFCGSCIAGFPQINELNKKYGHLIQFLLVTKINKDPKTAVALYERIRIKNKLELPIVFENQIVDRFGINGLPLYLVINPDGIVKAITYRLTESNIIEFLNGGNPSTPRNYLLEENPSKNYDFERPLLIGNNGAAESDFLYRSILTDCKPTMSSFAFINQSNRLELFCMDLKSLYKVAYIGKTYWATNDTVHYGKYFNDPILEVSDSSIFVSDEGSRKNLFCYSISFPRRVKKKNWSAYNIYNDTVLQRRVQRDLCSYFGYVAKLEYRDMPYYSLVSTTNSKKLLKTKSTERSVQLPLGDKAGILIAKNISIDELIPYILNVSDSPTKKNGYAILNNTGINFNIDISIDAVYFQDWIAELKKFGLDLIIDYKPMLVLVIKDLSST